MALEVPSHAPAPGSPYCLRDVTLLVEQVLFCTEVEVVHDHVALLDRDVCAFVSHLGQRAVEFVIAQIEACEKLVEQLCLCQLLLLHEVAEPQRTGNATTHQASSLLATEEECQECKYAPDQQSNPPIVLEDDVSIHWF